MMIKLTRYDDVPVYVSSQHIVMIAKYVFPDGITGKVREGCMIRTSESEEDLDVKNSAEEVAELVDALCDINELSDLISSVDSSLMRIADSLSAIANR